jgi:hypothetical protein
MLNRIAVLSAVLIASVAALAQTQEVRGTVTDSMCGRKHMLKNATPAQCTLECIKAGSDFALAVGDKLYIMKGDEAQMDNFAGANVVVRGDVHGTTIDVKQIKPAM